MPKGGRSQDDVETAPMLGAAVASSSGASHSADPRSQAHLQLSDLTGTGVDGEGPQQQSKKKSKKSKKHKSGRDPSPLGHHTSMTGGRVISGGTGGWDADGLLLDPSAAGGGLPSAAKPWAHAPPFWRYTMYGLVIGPWKFVRGLGWCLNKWQRLCRPLSALVFAVGDKMDKYMPTVHAFFLWFWNQISLMLHFVSVILTFSVAHLMYVHGRQGVAGLIAVLYILSHYLMGVIMYMEMDRITHSGRYTFGEFLTWCQRVFEALFWDLQLFVSLVHSNCMLEGLTQMLLKGFEEARVCIHFLVNTLPMCLILVVLYRGVASSWLLDIPDLDDLTKRSYEDTIWVAFVFSVLNVLEKWLRVSLADPWLHPDLNDCFPLAFMRSNAARLPRGLMLEWLFRCNLQLTQQEDELVLRTLFSIYTFNCKGDARELCDGHKAYLLRKALRTFNGSGKVHQAEVIARRLDQTKFRDPRTVRALDASDIHPGRYMSDMLSQVLGDSIGYSALNLANNNLGSSNISKLVDGLRANRVLQLRVLILNGNKIGEQGCQSIAKLLADSRSLTQLMLANNPLGDAGLKVLAEALALNKSLVKLDLTDVTDLTAESGSHLASVIKNNHTLTELLLRGVRVGGAGLEGLARALRGNSGLQTLDLSASGADDRVAAAFAQALSSNKTLTRLDLSHTAVADEGAKALCDAMQYNTTLQVCELSGTLADRSWMKLMSNIVTGRGGGGVDSGAGAGGR